MKTLPDIVCYKTLAAEVESSASVVSFFTKIADFFFDSIRVDEIVMLVYMRVSESVLEYGHNRSDLNMLGATHPSVVENSFGDE